MPGALSNESGYDSAHLGATVTPLRPRPRLENVQTVCDDALFDEENRMPIDHSGPQATSDESCRLQSPIPRSSSCPMLDSRIPVDDPSEETQPSSKKRCAEQPFIKCRPKEVDHSRELREELYEKEELVGRLRTRLRQQNALVFQERGSAEKHYVALFNEATSQTQNLLHRQEMELQALRVQLEGHKRERIELQGQICNTQELASKYHTEMENMRQKFESEMRTRLDEAVRTSNETITVTLQEQERERENERQEMVKQMQEEVQRVVAQQEREMAAMEQRHARTTHHNRQVRPDPGRRFSAQGAQTFGTTSTPSLDAIRRIKKSRGMSARTRLVGVCNDPSPTQLPPNSVPSNEIQPDPSSLSQPNTDAAAPLTAEAVAKAVEAALQNILGQKTILQPTKRSPRRRRAEDKEIELEKSREPQAHRDIMLSEVRSLFKRNFDITQDADFVAHESADAEDVYAFEHEDGPGPEVDELKFDLRHSYTSLWNSAIIEILLHEFQEAYEDERNAVKKSDNYVRELLKNRYKKLRTTWFKGQPKLLRDGRLETAEEVETRLVDEMDRRSKVSRQATRRRNKYHRRVATLNHIVGLKADRADEDIPAWKWLSDLIETLGEHGMSSEESSVENRVENVLRIKRMEWRRCIDRDLDIIDTERLLDDDIFAPQGAKPMKRIRAYDNPSSSRNAVTGLPMALYDSAWIAGLTQRQLDVLDVSPTTFQWMTIATTATPSP